ncbi:hypothetical protein BpHYR1_031337 [Brachionus plicatilis]|uniref:Uncharacterized protein n=1 Tax=Brachionus plicatilis TaxID=10195 RepID=A0A3M7SY85_BRAPC|nr:hypothetical protein BpHYR1_031337 [Brachionus plicatilis]
MLPLFIPDLLHQIYLTDFSCPAPSRPTPFHSLSPPQALASFPQAARPLRPAVSTTEDYPIIQLFSFSRK